MIDPIKTFAILGLAAMTAGCVSGGGGGGQTAEETLNQDLDGDGQVTIDGTENDTGDED